MSSYTEKLENYLSQSKSSQPSTRKAQDRPDNNNNNENVFDKIAFGDIKLSFTPFETSTTEKGNRTTNNNICSQPVSSRSFTPTPNMSTPFETSRNNYQGRSLFKKSDEDYDLDSGSPYKGGATAKGGGPQRNTSKFGRTSANPRNLQLDDLDDINREEKPYARTLHTESTFDAKRPPLKDYTDILKDIQHTLDDMKHFAKKNEQEVQRKRALSTTHSRGRPKMDFKDPFDEAFIESQVTLTSRKNRDSSNHQGFNSTVPVSHFAAGERFSSQNVNRGGQQRPGLSMSKMVSPTASVSSRKQSYVDDLLPSDRFQKDAVNYNLTDYLPERPLLKVPNEENKKLDFELAKSEIQSKSVQNSSRYAFSKTNTSNPNTNGGQSSTHFDGTTSQPISQVPSYRARRGSDSYNPDGPFSSNFDASLLRAMNNEKGGASKSHEQRFSNNQTNFDSNSARKELFIVPDSPSDVQHFSEKQHQSQRNKKPTVNYEDSTTSEENLHSEESSKSQQEKRSSETNNPTLSSARNRGFIKDTSMSEMEKLKLQEHVKNVLQTEESQRNGGGGFNLLGQGISQNMQVNDLDANGLAELLSKIMISFVDKAAKERENNNAKVAVENNGSAVKASENRGSIVSNFSNLSQNISSANQQQQQNPSMNMYDSSSRDYLLAGQQTTLAQRVLEANNNLNDASQLNQSRGGYPYGGAQSFKKKPVLKYESTYPIVCEAKAKNVTSVEIQTDPVQFADDQDNQNLISNYLTNTEGDSREISSIHSSAQKSPIRNQLAQQYNSNSSQQQQKSSGVNYKRLYVEPITLDGSTSKKKKLRFDLETIPSVSDRSHYDSGRKGSKRGGGSTSANKSGEKSGILKESPKYGSSGNSRIRLRELSSLELSQSSLRFSKTSVKPDGQFFDSGLVSPSEYFRLTDPWSTNKKNDFEGSNPINIKDYNSLNNTLQSMPPQIPSSRNRRPSNSTTSDFMGSFRDSGRQGKSSLDSGNNQEQSGKKTFSSARKQAEKVLSDINNLKHQVDLKSAKNELIDQLGEDFYERVNKAKLLFKEDMESSNKSPLDSVSKNTSARTNEFLSSRNPSFGIPTNVVANPRYSNSHRAHVTENSEPPKNNGKPFDFSFKGGSESASKNTTMIQGRRDSDGDAGQDFLFEKSRKNSKPWVNTNFLEDQQTSSLAHKLF